MHDGRFQTLAEVVHHYDSGVQASPTLDSRLRGRNGQPRRLNLSAAERAAVVAFLETLTDETLATDARWSDPSAGGATAAGPQPAPLASAARALAGPNPVRGATAFRVSDTGDVRHDMEALHFVASTAGDLAGVWQASGVDGRHALSGGLFPAGLTVQAGAGVGPCPRPMILALTASFEAIPFAAVRVAPGTPDEVAGSDVAPSGRERKRP